MTMNKEEAIAFMKNQTGRAAHFSNPLFDPWRNDKEVVCAMLNYSAGFKWAGEQIRDDEEVCYLAVSKDSGNLQFVSGRLKGNRDIVRKAVSNEGHAIAFASKKLREDREIMKLAFKEKPMSILSFSEKSLNDKAVASWVLQEQMELIEYLGREIKDDIFIMLNIYEYSPELFQKTCSPRIRQLCSGKDPQNILASIKQANLLHDTLPIQAPARERMKI